jgi:tyrosyl-tRNA synthetase
MKLPEHDLDYLRFTGVEPTDVDVILSRGVMGVIPEKEGERQKFKRRLEEGVVSVYLGIDPTGDKLHLGHAVPLRKLRQFQNLGHKAILLGGGFTATIGDPKGAETRKMLTPEQVTENMKDYGSQAGKILDMRPEAENSVTIKNNYDWLAGITLAKWVEIASNVTVQQILSHKTYRDRIEGGNPLAYHETFYPLMQGWDAVAMGVDAQIGGKDQTFNIYMGITLAQRYLDKPTWGVLTRLIEDPQTGKKMGKTEGNIVALVDSSEVKYEALRTWPDSTIPLGFELLTNVPMEKVAAAMRAVSEGKVHPNDLRAALAYRVVAELDGEEAAQFAEQEYERVYYQGQLPRNIREVQTTNDTSLVKILVDSGLAFTEAEARQKIASGAVFADGKPIKAKWVPEDNILLQVGKKTIAKVRRLLIV